MRIVLTGGSGQVGTILARHFHQQAHEVIVVARNAQPASWRTMAWDGQTIGAWANAIDGADVVINLAGRSVNCRYNAENRRQILESRTRTTALVGKAITNSTRPPRVWLNMSTATIYRHALDRPMDEATGEIGGNEKNAPDTWRFSIDVATRWEESLFAASTPGTRKVALRTAMVMSPDPNGVFDVLLRLVRMRLGGKAGSGKQYVSWVDDEDFVNAIDFLIAQDEISGAVNIASPNPLPNREFMRDLRRAWGTRIGLPATRWMLEIGAIFLRTETELILKSRRVVPGRLLEAGFTFRHAQWAEAAQDLVARWRRNAVPASP